MAECKFANIFEFYTRVYRLGFKFILKLVEGTSAFRKYNATYHTTKFPGCEKYEWRSKKYFACYIRHVGRKFIYLTVLCSHLDVRLPQNSLQERFSILPGAAGWVNVAIRWQWLTRN